MPVRVASELDRVTDVLRAFALTPIMQDTEAMERGSRVHHACGLWLKGKKHDLPGERSLKNL